MNSLFHYTFLMSLGVLGTAGCASDIASQEQAEEVGEGASAIEGGLANRLLAEHNRYRARHDAPALRWSSRIASRAQSWADGCFFSHSRGTGFGENLAWGSGEGNSTPELVVASWYDEKQAYTYSRPGFSQSTSHFTQVIWKATQEIGCGHAKCGNKDYWVCQYNPPGNVSGHFSTNVNP